MSHKKPLDLRHKFKLSLLLSNLNKLKCSLEYTQPTYNNIRQYLCAIVQLLKNHSAPQNSEHSATL